LDTPKQGRRRKLVSFAIILIILIAFVTFAAIEVNRWWQVRKEYVKMGFAEDKFPYRMYTERELVETGRWIGESQELINTPTRVRPEQTYAIFRQALMDGNMDKAVDCFVKNRKEEWRKSLYEIKEKEYLKNMLNDLPEKLEDTYFYTDDITGEGTKDRDLDHTTMSSYYYISKNDPERMAQTMTFLKNFDGDWLIEDL